MPPAPSARSFLLGPGHPLFLAAVALLLLNDHWLKGLHPGPWLTGKLSDVAWLVVSPVLLAAGLALLRLSGRAVRGLALLIPAVAFTALQLWSPLGDTWVHWMGGHHVADPTDLLALPAVLLALIIWRPRTHRTRSSARRILGVVAGTTALVATSGPSDLRNPCDGQTEWDPAQPLVFDWAFATAPDNPGLLATGITLTDATGARVPFDVVPTTAGPVLVCPTEPLEPGATYTWKIGNWKDLGPHVRHVPYHSEQGRWTFTTSTESTFAGGCTKDATWMKPAECYLDSGGW